MQRPKHPRDSIMAQLAGQLEVAKEQLQQHADVAHAAKLAASSALAQATQQVGWWDIWLLSRSQGPRLRCL